MRLVSIVIPARNEAKNIQPLMARLRQMGEASPAYEFEFVFVNDGSTDGTGEELRAAAEEDERVRRAATGIDRGLTRALELGFGMAEGEWIIFIPADLQSDPVRDVPLLLAALEEGADLVLGVRTERRGYKKLVSRIYHRLAKLVFGVCYRDMNWIKGFRRELLEQFRLRYEWHRYLPVFAFHAGMRVAEVVVEEQQRRSGSSKFGVLAAFRGLQDLLTLQFDLLFLRRPMRFFGTVGMICLLLAAVQALLMLGYLTATGFEVRLGVGFYAMLILLVVVGLQFFGFGLFAEYLAHLIDKIENQRNEP